MIEIPADRFLVVCFRLGMKIIIKNNMGIVSAFMENDHAYLDRLWAVFLNERKNLARSSGRLARFKHRLKLHVRLEDEFLFPRLTDYCGLDKNTGLTGMARRDHAVILKLLGLVEKAYGDRRFEKVMLAGGNLDRALKKHRNREVAIQYPVSDRFIHRSEWRRMLIKVYGRAINQKMI